jgi:Uma2 family endonuclease
MMHARPNHGRIRREGRATRSKIRNKGATHQELMPVTSIAEFTTAPRSAEIDYPTSDGRPMGETDLHRNVMFESIESLKLYFAGQQVYVSGNLLLYYQPGNRRRHVSPDVLVVKGLDPRDRNNYLLWEEGRPPQVVIEVTSESTREEDLFDKLEIYRDRIRVAEYFMFDPRGEYLEPALQGYRLIGDRYEPMEMVVGRIESQELGLLLEKHGPRLRFFNPATGNWIPTLQEMHQAAEAQRQRAEAEAERLRQELQRLRKQLEK